MTVLYRWNLHPELLERRFWRWYFAAMLAGEFGRVQLPDGDEDA